MKIRLQPFLLILAAVHLLLVGGWIVWEWTQVTGLRHGGDGMPLGGDFANLWTAALMMASGQAVEIYRPEAFMDAQFAIFGPSEELRLWVYPPTSLILFGVFGAVSYVLAFALWTLLGLGVLWWGARRVGLGILPTALLLSSPAVLHCIYFGQSGNLAAGLLLAALSYPARGAWGAGAATVALTVKPQLGVLVPVSWAIQGAWRMIGVVALAVLCLWGAGLAGFGFPVWQAYLGETLPVLRVLEYEGSGPFVFMIPSVFMAVRVLSGTGELAALIQLPVSVGVFLFSAWRLYHARSLAEKTAMVLVGTAALSPYIHIYDLSIVLAGAFMLRKDGPQTGDPVSSSVGAVILVAWALPYITVIGNAAGAPVGTMALFGVLLLLARASWPSTGESSAHPAPDSVGHFVHPPE